VPVPPPPPHPDTLRAQEAEAVTAVAEAVAAVVDAEASSARIVEQMARARAELSGETAEQARATASDEAERTRVRAAAAAAAAATDQGWLGAYQQQSVIGSTGWEQSMFVTSDREYPSDGVRLHPDIYFTALLGDSWKERIGNVFTILSVRRKHKFIYIGAEYSGVAACLPTFAVHFFRVGGIVRYAGFAAPGKHLVNSLVCNIVLEMV
jgi:hypothetical protein